MSSQPAQASIGVTGLAVMGRNLARNLARHGHTVALYNRTGQRTQDLVEHVRYPNLVGDTMKTLGT